MTRTYERKYYIEVKFITGVIVLSFIFVDKFEVFTLLWYLLLFVS